MNNRYRTGLNLGLRLGFILFVVSRGMLTFAQQNYVKSLSFEGNTRTQTAFLLKFVHLREGMPCDSAAVEKDLQNLRSLQFFTGVEMQVHAQGNAWDIVFSIRENLTTIPFVDIGGLTGNPYVTLGWVSYHLQGRGRLLGTNYRYDGRHSFQLYLQEPYLNYSRWGIGANIQRYATTEPFSINGNPIDLDFTNFTVETWFRYEFKTGHSVQFGGAALSEQYNQTSPLRMGLEPVSLDFNKYLVKGVHSYGSVAYYYERVKGYSNQIWADYVFPYDNEPAFWKVFNEFRYYKYIGKRGNLASRLRLGVSPMGNITFAPFILDSYINIRGSGNRVARGTAEIVLNAEYRHTFSNLTVGGQPFARLQGVIFTDIGSWRLIDRELFEPGNISSFAGIGFRGHIFKVYNLVCRIDLGQSLQNSRQRGLVIGLGQFF